MELEVVSLDDIHPDPINPRERIADTAAALNLSLLKLGHVLPLVIDTDGAIVSGHQRHTSLRDLGASVAPAFRVGRPPDDLFRGARLMLFNLASADIADRVNHDPSSDRARLDDVMSRLAERPDVDLDDPDAWPCMNIAERDPRDFLDANPDIVLGKDSKADGTLVLARSPYKVKLPILVDPSGKVVVGRQRFAAAVTSDEATWPTITVEDDALIGDTLNAIAMGYAAAPMVDVMRASVWLQAAWRRKRLGLGFTHYVAPSEPSHAFELDERRDEWVDKHGSYVADIGAGHMSESALLNEAGIRSVAFEPYAVPPGEARPDRDHTRKMARVFLDEIAKGKPFTSVFASAVLNQVPFEEDRYRVLSLVHALCGPRTHAYISCLGTHASAWQTFASGRNSPRPLATDLRVGGFEPRTQVTSLGQGRVMIQKWHTEDELTHLVSQFWKMWRVGRSADSLFVEAWDPVPMKRGNVRRAIEFEFDLPWGDGERLGLVDEALAAFSKRLRIEL